MLLAMRKAGESVVRARRVRRAGGVVLASLLALALAGCPDDSGKDKGGKDDEADAGANRALMDKNIEKAMKSMAGTPTAAPMTRCSHSQYTLPTRGGHQVP